MPHQDVLCRLFKSFTGQEPETVAALPVSGSDRRYYRLSIADKSIIGACNDELKENEAFFYFTTHFLKKKLPVPEVLLISDDRKAYLQTDLGDETLFSLLGKQGLNEEVKKYYRQTVGHLLRFQVAGFEGLHTDYCYPRARFDRQSMHWDLNYFKYYFARLSGLRFDEQALENDFETLISFLEEADSDFFMFRDFQSRNIMIRNNSPFFIDYQGGRAGALQYDLASLLYDAKADLPKEFRQELLELYLAQLDNLAAEYFSDTLQNRHFSRTSFLKYFDGFILMRILQAMGAYGYRGYYQKKEHFLKSIPYALKNLEQLLSGPSFPILIPELRQLLEAAMHDSRLAAIAPAITGAHKLHVRVTSFSYKRGIPKDNSEHGGGFVFDCRALPNPGRLPEYKPQSGLDEPVVNYLREYEATEAFLKHVNGLVDAAVTNYLERGFDHLMISFGCTGGRHRSVYFAEKLAGHLNEKFGLNVSPEHTEQPYWNL